LKVQKAEQKQQKQAENPHGGKRPLPRKDPHSGGDSPATRQSNIKNSAPKNESIGKKEEEKK
jgi:hypothetical protein